MDDGDRGKRLNLIVEVVRRVAGNGNVRAAQRLERLRTFLHGRQQLGMVAGLNGQRAVGHGRLREHHHVDMFLIAGGRRVTHHLVVVIRRGLGAHTADNSQLFHRRLLGDARTIARIIPAPVRYKPGGRDVHPICNTS